MCTERFILFIKKLLLLVLTGTLFSVNVLAQLDLPLAKLIGEYESVGSDPGKFGFSKTNEFFYSLQSDGSLIVRSVSDQAEKFRIRDVRSVRSIVFSPDDKYVLVVQKKKSLIVSTRDGSIVNTLEKPLYGSREAIWSPAGNEVAGWIDDYNAGIFSSLDGKVLHTFNTHERKKLAVQRLMDMSAGYPTCRFSPAGDRLLTIYGDAEAELWDVKTGNLLYSFTDRLRPPYTAALNKLEPIGNGEFSSNGQWIYTSSYEGGRLWNAQTGKLVKDLDGFQFAYFSPENRFLGPLVSSGTKSSSILDLRTMQIISLGAAYSGRFGIFSPDGTMILGDRTGDEVNKQEAYLFDTASGKMLWSTKTYAKYCFDPVSTCISDSDKFLFSPNSLFLTVSNKKSVRILTARDGKTLMALDDAGWPFHWSADSKMILCRGIKTGRLRLYRLN